MRLYLPFMLGGFLAGVMLGNWSVKGSGDMEVVRPDPLIRFQERVLLSEEDYEKLEEKHALASENPEDPKIDNWFRALYLLISEESNDQK